MEGKVFLCQSLIWAMILLGQIHGYQSCTVKERKAMLELKRYLASHSIYPNDTLPSWTNDTNSDCCRWEGVKCNRTTMRVIRLSFDSLFTKENALLNLSLLHPFEDLQSLDLSEYGYKGSTGLFDDVEGYKSLGRLRNLKILDFSYNNFNNSIFPFLNAATSLTTLFLRGNLFLLKFASFLCSLPFLSELKDLTNLEHLDLSENRFNGSTPIRVFCEMRNLQELNLALNHLEGQLPMCLGSLNKLQVLDLSSNKISGDLPSSFSGLKSLDYLSLSDNNFTGLFSLSPLANLTKLKVFKLSSTSDMIQVETESTWQPKFQLSVASLPLCSLDKIPNFLINQKNLRLIDLSSNRLSGDIPTWLLENNPKLEVLLLKNNSFTIFHMPTTLVHKLEVLDFSANDIGGVLPHNIGRSLPSLFKMNGSNNVFQGNLPSSMGEMKNITILDLSHNNFTGELPRRFLMGCFSLEFLKLSHNKFCGHFLARRTNFKSLGMLRINNNLITGKIGAGLRSFVKLTILDISNNRLTGDIPIWVSNLSLDILMISNNFLQGAIPPSLLLTESLSFMDLSGNLLSGALPSHLLSSEYSGKSLFLDNNSFTGEIPATLSENVTMLDLRNNKLSGGIPHFVNAQDLRILLLRETSLTGSIPKQLCDLSNIRLLDLSDNKLNGFIPSCINSLSFGLGGGEETYSSYGSFLKGYYALEFYKSKLVSVELELDYGTSPEFEIKFATKQRYDSYNGASEISRGTLDFMYGLDLSSNELSGVIPAELGDLSKLRVMNLSHNFLSSSIPDSFSKLEDIESLDLSFNMLHGSIPQQLTNLTFLSSFNVSFNNLSGIIPKGRQFNTFYENSYLRNPFLCGQPTEISCGAKKSSEETDNEGGRGEDEDDEAPIDMLVFYWSIAATYVIALIGSLVLMSFDCPWRRTLLRRWDAFIVSAKSLFS